MNTLSIFQQNVLQYDEIDKTVILLKQQIKPVQANIKQLMFLKKELQVEICSFMAKNKVRACNLPKIDQNVDQKALKFLSSETVIPMTQVEVHNQLVKFFRTQNLEKFNSEQPEEKARIVHSFIYDRTNREKKIRESIRKVKFVKSA